MENSNDTVEIVETVETVETIETVEPVETVKYDNHNFCTTDSTVFETVKECKYKHDSENIFDKESESKSCLGNFCISCGYNLGDHNPRQYCNKLYCPYE